MSWTIKGAAAAILVSASVGLSACGNHPTASTTPQTAQLLNKSDDASAQSDVVSSQSDEDKGSDKKKGWESFLNKLNLTAEQKAQIKVVKDECKPTFTKDEIQTMADQFKAAMLADTVDKAALKSWLTPILQKVDGARPARIDAIEKIRNILTPEQRQTVAAAILDHLTKHKDKMAKSEQKDSIWSPEQRAAHQAKRTQMMAGLASYMLTGDKAALTTALTPDKSVDQRAEAMTDALAGLSLEKRKALVAKMEKKMAKMQKKMSKKSVLAAADDENGDNDEAQND